MTTYTTEQGLASDHVWSIEGGTTAACGSERDGGLSRFKDGRFTNFTTRDGLSSNIVWAVHEGRDGSLWIGTFGGGLNRLKDGRFDVYTSADGLPDTSVRAIQEDSPERSGSERTAAAWPGCPRAASPRSRRRTACRATW